MDPSRDSAAEPASADQEDPADEQIFIFDVAHAGVEVEPGVGRPER